MMNKMTEGLSLRAAITVGGLVAVMILGTACKQEATAEITAKKLAAPGAEKGKLTIPDESKEPENAGYAVLGAGCFWCVEEVLQQMDGVTAVVSGYTGGTSTDANYEAVCTGQTDHVEVVKVTFDQDKVSYSEVLDTFWKLHDPTTVNRQGPDRGRQYRSAIFYQNDEEKAMAEASKKKLGEAGIYPSAIVTQIVPLEKFYLAEDYHQNYARRHPDDGYIRAILFPKLKKLHLQIPE